MAIYHFSMSNVSRAQGSASTATLSYITGEKVQDERLGQTFYGFSRQERIEHTGVMLPEGAPESFRDPAVMFNSIEQYEKTDTARPAKKLELAMPREWTLAQQIEYGENFIRDNFTSKGYAAVYGIHNDPKNNNPHIHILVPNRAIDPQTHDWEKVKTRKEYALDEKGGRIPVIDTETGQQKYRERPGKGRELLWQRVTVERNLLDNRDFLQELRANWAKECNRHLEPDQQIDHRSFKDRGIEYEPTRHEGYAAREIEKRGGVSDRVQYNEGVRERNTLIDKIKALGKQIADLFREKGAERHDRIAGLLQRSRSGRAGGRAGEEHTREGEAAERERTAVRGSAAPEKDDIKSFVAGLDAQEQGAAAGRADREAEQLRLAAERSRKEAEERRKALERAARNSRGYDGPSL